MGVEAWGLGLGAWGSESGGWGCGFQGGSWRLGALDLGVKAWVLRVWGLEIGVQGWGFGVGGWGLRVWGLGCGRLGFRVMVMGLGVGITQPARPRKSLRAPWHPCPPAFGYRISGFEFWFSSGFGFREFQFSRFELRVSNFAFRDSGFQFPVSNSGFQDSGFEFRDSCFGIRVSFF